MSEPQCMCKFPRSSCPDCCTDCYACAKARERRGASAEVAELRAALTAVRAERDRYLEALYFVSLNCKCSRVVEVAIRALSPAGGATDPGGMLAPKMVEASRAALAIHRARIAENRGGCETCGEVDAACICGIPDGPGNLPAESPGIGPGLATVVVTPRAPRCPVCGGDGKCKGPCGDCAGYCHRCFGSGLESW